MRRTRLAREESGQVLVLFAAFLVVLVGFAALVIDVGDWFGTKRVAQAAADAGALAAAQDLCEDTDVAIAVGEEYVGRNLNPATATVTTPYNGNENLVEVTVDTTADSFFAGVFGIDFVDIQARAVAGADCIPVEQPLAIFVHELCGADTGDKGLIVGGENALIQGGIHVNGHLEIGDSGFESELMTTVYRPPVRGGGSSPQGPTQGSGCKTDWKSDSIFCSQCEGGPTDGPVEAPYRDWATPYHTAQDVIDVAGPCTHTHNNDRKFEDNIPNGVHCLPPDKKFTLAGDIGSSGSPASITVIAGEIELGDTSILRPYKGANPDNDVLFYSTNTDDNEVTMNPSGQYDWEGYIINRFGGVKANAQGVTSPFNGLIEAEWIEINGQDFTMLGTFPDTVPGGVAGNVVLEE